MSEAPFIIKVPPTESPIQYDDGFSTTFKSDFTIADAFGEDAVRDTYKRAFNEWKGQYRYLTDLVITLNHKIYEHHEKGNKALSQVYDELWKAADAYACDNLKGDELAYFYKTTD